MARIWWVATGAVLACGVLAILTIGILLIAVGVAMVAIGVATRALRGPGAALVISGAALGPLYLAWLNRGGPGDVCTMTAQSSECTQEWSPWPFLAVGIFLALIGIALDRRLRRAEAQGGPSPGG